MSSKNSNHALNNIGQRLGITSESILKKAEEYLRASASRTGGIKSLNDVAKTVICLDLACSNQGTRFDIEMALKLAGLKRSTYQNHVNTFKKILGLDRCVSISELCIQLNCTVVKDMAVDLYNKYKSSDIKIKDFDHPQFVAAAVYAACKAQNVKVDRTALVAASHLKPASWKEFSEDYLKFAESCGISRMQKSKINKEKKNQDNTDEVPMETEVLTTSKPNNNQVNGEEIEDYEVWKKRILDEAYQALGMEKN